MDITIAVCTWNRSCQLRATLDSISKMDIPKGIQWELIVVDNNSPDDTQDVLASFKDRLPLRTFIEMKQGVAYARNRVVREANGEYIFWTDDDVQLSPDWLLVNTAAFENYAADIVYGIVKPLWETKQPSWYSYKWFHGKFALLDYGPTTFVATEIEHTFYGVNHAGKTQVFRDLNGYCEDAGPVADAGGESEDLELYKRAVKAGMKIVYEPASMVEHVVGDIRCHKKYHRRRTWNGALCYFRMMQSGDDFEVPKIMDLPRYLYRFAIDDIWNYLRAIFKRDRGERFYYELQLILFVSLLKEAIGHQWSKLFRKHSTPAVQSPENNPTTSQREELDCQ